MNIDVYRLRRIIFSIVAAVFFWALVVLFVRLLFRFAFDIVAILAIAALSAIIYYFITHRKRI